MVVALAGILPWALAIAGVHAPELAQVFHTLCHQRPERTLAIFGAPMLVCSRCAGVYAGVALGVVLVLPRTWLPRGRTLVIAALAAAVAEIAVQDLGLHPPWHATRLATGLMLGWTASAFMFATLGNSLAPKMAASR